MTLRVLFNGTMLAVLVSTVSSKNVIQCRQCGHDNLPFICSDYNSDIGTLNDCPFFCSLGYLNTENGNRYTLRGCVYVEHWSSLSIEYIDSPAFGRVSYQRILKVEYLDLWL